MNLDCSTITGEDGTALSGDMASRILDLAGIVVNRNTIPGDTSAADPSGIRMGTPWITQRGFKERETMQLADIIADILMATKPHGRGGMAGKIRRAKVSFNMLEEAKLRVRTLAESAGIDYQPVRHGYPHFYYLDDQPLRKDWAVLELSGDHVRQFLNYALTSDVESLGSGIEQPTSLITAGGEITGKLTCIEAKRFRLTIPAKQAGLVKAWLRDLSDGFIEFDRDIMRKLPGLTEIEEVDGEPGSLPTGSSHARHKPYYAGIADEIAGGEGESLPQFNWQEQENMLRRTPIFETHKRLGAKIIPFAGWEMPVWYSSVLEEHLAVRQSAGLFDVAHMGVYQVEGPDAEAFLDSVVANAVSILGVGESCYTHFLDPDASVIDDLLVYRRGKEKFMLVVNASNDDKDWAWLTAVKDGNVLIDRQRPWVRAYGRNAILKFKTPKKV
jgi:glycine hydroxymethyltransferase